MKLVEPNRNVLIKGRMIFLKPITRNEITKRYVCWLNDKDVNRFLECRHKKQTKRDIYAYINMTRRKPGCDIFAIFTKKNREHIGNLGLFECNPHHGYVVYGIMIGNKRAQSMGLGGEASFLLVEYLFRDPTVRKICANIYSKNISACRLLENIGFVKEGVARAQVRLEGNNIDDMYYYGLLKEEWGKSRMRFKALLDMVSINRDD